MQDKSRLAKAVPVGSLATHNSLQSITKQLGPNFLWSICSVFYVRPQQQLLAQPRCSGILLRYYVTQLEPASQIYTKFTESQSLFLAQTT